MSVGKRRDGRQLENMKTNTHGQNQSQLNTTPASTQGPNPQCERLLLDIDQRLTAMGRSLLRRQGCRVLAQETATSSFLIQTEPLELFEWSGLPPAI